MRQDHAFAHDRRLEQPSTGEISLRSSNSRRTSGAANRLGANPSVSFA
jgi:hypothetical protein